MLQKTSFKNPSNITNIITGMRQINEHYIIHTWRKKIKAYTPVTNFPTCCMYTNNAINVEYVSGAYYPSFFK